MCANKIKGFTLIEVLIALAILSIALTSIIKYTSQNIRDTNYLQNKMIAMWVGTQIMNEARVGILTLPQHQVTKMLGQNWPWEANVVSTPNSHIKEIDVDVMQESNQEKLIHLVSYVYLQ